MEYIQDQELTELKGKILCCHCGVSIEPNPANMCVGCIRTEVDITEGIPKQATIHFCRGCERYFQPPSDWIHCSLESRELLALCLRKLKGLNRVKLIDAGFVWTEPHSKRIKVKLSVQGEVIGGAVLQQVFIVEYTVANQMCDDCHRTEAQNFWRAVVQVRQRAQNKKTFYYLEQLILKHKAHENTLGIKQIHEGLDFFYSTEAHARRMLDFLNSALPVRFQQSKKLLSHDIHSNIYNYKFTYSVEIVPVSKDSLVCLSKKTSNQLGGISSLCLVQRVTNAIHLIDPSTAQIAEVSGSSYWRDPFNSVFDPKQLTEFTVMDIEPIIGNKNFPGQGQVSSKHILADIWVVKTSELGICENTIHTRSHLGHILKPGDSVLGYFFRDSLFHVIINRFGRHQTAGYFRLCYPKLGIGQDQFYILIWYTLNESNINDDNFEMLNKDKVPDVILVKKYYGGRIKKRIWKLKHLKDGGSVGSANMDYTSFLEDLEEDPIYRQNVNIYKNPQQLVAVDADDVDDPDEPRITLEEMLDDLNIEDV